jgi:hypothetical protein
MTWFWLGGSTQGATTDTSTELLARLRLVTRRPENDRDLTNARAYTFLTDAQTELVYNLSAHIPDIMKGAPKLMTTSDGGLTYSFPNNEDPLGSIEIYPAPYMDPLIEGPLWSTTADYAREGSKKIRMANGRARTFADGPWARYIVKPGVIDAAKQPTIQPVDLRRVLPWKAAEIWAETGNQYDPTPYRNRAQKMLWGDPESPGDLGIIPAYKLQHMSSGMTSSPGLGLWWRSPDLRSG